MRSLDKSPLGLHQSDWPVIVAVAIMLVVQMAIDQVIDVVAMGHSLMSAARTMDVVGVVTGTLMTARTGVRILLGDRDRVLVDMPVMRMVQMTIV